MFSKRQVAQYMSPQVHGIEPHESLATAQKRMLDFNIRHLAVRTGGKIVGIISARDISLLEVFEHLDLAKTPVGKVMINDPYLVEQNHSIKEVAKEMYKYGYGSALVVDENQQVIGIFTEKDAVKAISES